MLTCFGPIYIVVFDDNYKQLLYFVAQTQWDVLYKKIVDARISFVYANKPKMPCDR